MDIFLNEKEDGKIDVQCPLEVAKEANDMTAEDGSIWS
jgi:hypothetical protein